MADLHALDEEYRVLQQDSWSPRYGGWGYYTYHDEDCGCIMNFVIREYMNLPEEKMLFINKVRTFLFSPAKGLWYIGADFTDQRERFPIQGPYDTSDLALLALRFMADTR